MSRKPDQYHPSSSSHGQAFAKIEKYMTNDGSLRAASVVCTEVIEEARGIHKSFPLATAALGRTLIAAGLLSSFMKEKEKISLQFKGDGPLGQVFAEGTHDGFVRGFVQNPFAEIPSFDGKLPVGLGIGQGSLAIATSAPFEKAPYTGMVEIQTGEIAEDIAYYLFQSMQIPSIVALGTYIDTDQKVTAAGGMIVQLMPGATEKLIEKLETKVRQMRSVTDMIRSGAGPTDLLVEVVDDLSILNFGSERYLSYSCHCTIERVESALNLLGVEELTKMIADQEQADIRCEFCGRSYKIPPEQIKKLIEKSTTVKS